MVSPPAAVLGLPASLALGGRRVRTGAFVMAIVALAAVSAVLAATSGHVQHPTATSLYYGYLVAASLLAALCWHLRRPSSSFGPLLAAFGLSAWAISWQSSVWPLPFDLAVLADAVYFTLTYYLLLAFPSGRLETWVNRGLIAADAPGAVRRRELVAAVPAGLLRLPLLARGPGRRSGHARGHGLGARGHARGAPARVPRGAVPGGAVRRLRAWPAARAAPEAPLPAAMARGDRDGRGRPVGRAGVLGSRHVALPAARRSRAGPAAARHRAVVGDGRARRPARGGDGARRRPGRRPRAGTGGDVGDRPRRRERGARGRAALVAGADHRSGRRRAAAYRARHPRQRAATTRRPADQPRAHRRASPGARSARGRRPPRARRGGGDRRPPQRRRRRLPGGVDRSRDRSRAARRRSQRGAARQGRGPGHRPPCARGRGDGVLLLPGGAPELRQACGRRRVGQGLARARRRRRRVRRRGRRTWLQPAHGPARPRADQHRRPALGRRRHAHARFSEGPRHAAPRLAPDARGGRRGRRRVRRGSAQPTAGVTAGAPS